MGKNFLMAAVLGLLLFGAAPGEASATDLAVSSVGTQVEAVEVMHRPPHFGHGGWRR